MPGNRRAGRRVQDIRTEYLANADERGGKRGEVAANLIANRRDAPSPWIVNRPARPEATRAAKAIGHPTRDRQHQQTGLSPGGHALSQRIDQPLHNLLRTVRADLVAAMTDHRVADARHRCFDVSLDRHSRY